MKQLGDITKIHGNLIEPVDCITFGSPCQDLSIAGHRAGLDGERSGLFMEAVRVIKEMRRATNGKYPTFAIWENVPGAFSSNNGEDFRTVLAELSRIEQPDASIPRLEGRWKHAGLILGNSWSIAWRLFDAQYWGVPQRRKRIALVADFGGQRAGEVLFERTSLSGNTEPSCKAWQSFTCNTERSVAGDDRTTYCLQGNIIDRSATAGANSIGCKEDKSYTLNTIDRHAVAYSINSLASNSMKSLNPHSGFNESKTSRTLDCSDQNPSKNQGGMVVVQQTLCLNDQGGQCMSLSVDKTNALRVQEHRHQPIVLDARDNDDGKIVPTITGDHESRITDYTAITFSKQSFGSYKQSDVSKTLEAHDAKGNAGLVVTKEQRWIVRRLTPTECERLQGYPDGWTDIGEWVDSKGKTHKSADTARYKALGSSIALPQWYWIAQKVQPYLPKNATLGSLFNGIGGFPLVWQAVYGDGTAKWASEIEEFPMAVTRARFEE